MSNAIASRAPSAILLALLALLATLSAAPTAIAQHSIDKILAERDENKKGQMSVRYRKDGLPSEDMFKLLKREKMDSIVALIGGMYLEKGSFEPGKTAMVVKGMAARRGMLGKAVTMAALSPHRDKIVGDFMKSRHRNDRMLAAYIVATWAWSQTLYTDDNYVPPIDVKMRRNEKTIEQLEAEIAAETEKRKENPGWDNDLKPAEKKELKEKEAAREQKLQQLKRQTNRHVYRPQLLKRGSQLGDFDIEPIVKELLDERTGEVQELAILAAAFARMKSLKEPIAELRISTRDEATEAARQLYLARIGEPVDHDAIGDLLTRGSRMRPDPRFTRLTPAIHDYDVRLPAVLYTLQAIAAAGETRHLDTLHELLNHADLRVQQDAARAIEGVGDRKSVPVLLEKLKTGFAEDDDHRRRTRVEPITWPVKVAVLSAIGAIPSETSMDTLIAGRMTEKGRLRQDYNYAMASITLGEHGKAGDEWRSWWNLNRKRFQVDEKATAQWRRHHRPQDMTPPALTTFYGANIVSDRLVFVLDTSASMKGEKIESLKANMEETLGSVLEFMKFNIVDFGGTIRVMSPKGLIDAKFHEKVAYLVQNLDLSGGTRTYDAMEVGMLQPEADTVMYLSDGAPIAGQFESWDALRRGLTLFNRYRPLALHAIYYSNNKGKGRRLAGNQLQMLLLADHNAGLMSQPN